MSEDLAKHFVDFLISASTEVEADELLQKVSFDKICTIAIAQSYKDQDGIHSVSEETADNARDVLRKLFCLPRLLKTYTIDPIKEAILNNTVSEFAKQDVVAFLSASLNSAEQFAPILEKIIGSLVQLFTILCCYFDGRMYSAGMAPNPWDANELQEKVGKAAKLIVGPIFLAMLDHDDVGVAECARRSIVNCGGMRDAARVFEEELKDVELICKESLIQWLNEGKVSSTLRRRNAFAWWRVAGLEEELAMRLGGKMDKRTVNKDVLKIRSASIIINLSDDFPFERPKEHMREIIDGIYRSDDLLLRLAATELAHELLKSHTGLTFLKENQKWTSFLADLKDSVAQESAGDGPTVGVTLLRLLSNLIEQHPDLKEQVLRDPKNEKVFINCVKHYLNWPRGETHFLMARNAGLSAIGCIGSGLDPVGLALLDEMLEGWVGEFEHSLNQGTEMEVMAAMTAILRLIGGVEGGLGGVEGGHGGVEEGHEKTQPPKQTAKVEEVLLPCLLSTGLKRPFEGPRELFFQIMAAMTDINLRRPLEAFVRSEELQLLLFAPLYSDPPKVKYAKHRFCKSAVRRFNSFLESNGPKKFAEALVWWSEHASWERPPQYLGKRKPTLSPCCSRLQRFVLLNDQSPC